MVNYFRHQAAWDYPRLTVSVHLELYKACTVVRIRFFLGFSILSVYLPVKIGLTSWTTDILNKPFQSYDSLTDQWFSLS